MVPSREEVDLVDKPLHDSNLVPVESLWRRLQYGGEEYRWGPPGAQCSEVLMGPEDHD